MKCICEIVKEGYPETISIGNWINMYMVKKDGEYYIEAVADGKARMILNYCPVCGRKLEEDDE